MAFVSEDRRGEGLLPDQSVETNMGLVVLPRFSGPPAGTVRLQRLGAAVRRQAEKLRLRTSDLRTQAAGRLSGGNQQKAVIGKWLLHGPRLLLLDEPTRGIDVAAKRDVYEIINDLASAGTGIVMVSSELEELVGMCDRVLVMNRGRMTASFGRGEFDTAAILAAAFGTRLEPGSWRADARGAHA
jgi:ribose transport system ATP-binding protein